MSTYPSAQAQEQFFRFTTQDLRGCRKWLGLNQNDYHATAARRELIQLCVEIAKEHGDDI